MLNHVLGQIATSFPPGKYPIIPTALSCFARPQARLLSPDFGKHLLEVEDLLQKHALVEADIGVQAERVRSANTAALQFANGDSE